MASAGEDEELKGEANTATLMAENARLHRDVLILKNSGLARLGEPRRVVNVYRFMQANRFEFTIHEMARVLQVARSGYYRWLGQSEQRLVAEKNKAMLIQKMRTLHTESRGRYGARRLYKALQLMGIQISLRRVRSLMRESGIRCVNVKDLH